MMLLKPEGGESYLMAPKDRPRTSLFCATQPARMTGRAVSTAAAGEFGPVQYLAGDEPDQEHRHRLRLHGSEVDGEEELVPGEDDADQHAGSTPVAW